MVPWLHLSATKGSGNSTIIITGIDSNTTGTNRTANVQITAIGYTNLKPLNITVIQKPTIFQLLTDSTHLSLGATKNSMDSFTILSNIRYRITSSDTWLGLSDTAGSGHLKVYVTAKEENMTGSTRTGTISIIPIGSPSLSPVVITVSQLSVSLSDAWKIIMGGSSGEGLGKIVPSGDGGYVIVGSTSSNDGDLISTHTVPEAWIIKINTNGGVVWSKLLGGSGNDIFRDLIATNDGGYIVVGSTNSNPRDTVESHSDYDIWILKVDGNGRQLWSKYFGGSMSDEAYAISSTQDGGCIVVGSTASNNGDVTGLHGSDDGLVMKIDGNGNKQWMKLFGGSRTDAISSITPTTDGGYIMTGASNSNDGDINGLHSTGASDAWVTKIDGAGNKIWSKLFGSTRNDNGLNVITTSDGGCLMSGVSQGNDGDVSGNHGGWDTWLLKIDQNGAKQWSKLIGGNGDDILNMLAVPPKNQYLLFGRSTSNNDAFSGNHGLYDGCLLQVDATGNILATKLYGGSQNDYFFGALPVSDNTYIISGNTGSSDGDFIMTHGGYADALVMKIKFP